VILAGLFSRALTVVGEGTLDYYGDIQTAVSYDEYGNPSPEDRFVDAGFVYVDKIVED
jgi:hypothetical protein